MRFCCRWSIFWEHLLCSLFSTVSFLISLMINCVTAEPAAFRDNPPDASVSSIFLAQVSLSRARLRVRASSTRRRKNVNSSENTKTSLCAQSLHRPLIWLSDKFLCGRQSLQTGAGFSHRVWEPLFQTTGRTWPSPEPGDTSTMHVSEAPRCAEARESHTQVVWEEMNVKSMVGFTGGGPVPPSEPIRRF